MGCNQQASRAAWAAGRKPQPAAHAARLAGGSPMSIIYLTENEVRELLTMDLALTAVGAAFRKMALEEAQNIPRQRCQTDNVMLHVLPAAAKTLNALGLKAYTTGKFGAKFHVYLFDPKNGDLTAILEADH